MASVHVGIGHDDHLMVTELAQVQCLAVLLCSYGHSESGVDVADFFAFEDSVLHGLLHIEDLSSERQDGLGYTVTSLLCSTACRVSLDEEELALLRIP